MRLLAAIAILLIAATCAAGQRGGFGSRPSGVGRPPMGSHLNSSGFRWTGHGGGHRSQAVPYPVPYPVYIGNDNFAAPAPIYEGGPADYIYAAPTSVYEAPPLGMGVIAPPSPPPPPPAQLPSPMPLSMPAPQQNCQAPVVSQRALEDNRLLYFIALKDGWVLTAVAYWISDGTLHYMTPENEHNQVSLTLIDRKVSAKLNPGQRVDYAQPYRN